MGKKPSLKSAVMMSLCSCLAGEGVGAGEGKEIGRGVSRALGGRGNTGRPQDDEGVINTLEASDRERSSFRFMAAVGNTGRPQDDEGVINTLGASDRESLDSWQLADMMATLVFKLLRHLTAHVNIFATVTDVIRATKITKELCLTIDTVSMA